MLFTPCLLSSKRSIQKKKRKKRNSRAVGFLRSRQEKQVLRRTFRLSKLKLFEFVEKLANGTAGSPASPNPGPEEPSIYYDATENRPTANVGLQKETSITTASTTVQNVVPHRDNKDNKEKETSCRTYIAHSKIPIPVKSPRCSLSETTPENNTPNAKAGIGSEIEKLPAPAAATKEKDNS